MPLYQQILLTQNLTVIWIQLSPRVILTTIAADDLVKDFYMRMELWHNNQPYQLLDYGFKSHQQAVILSKIFIRQLQELHLLSLMIGIQ